MAPFENMSTVEKEEFAVSLATLILADAHLPVNKENLDKLVKESGCKIAPYWTAIFGASCEDKDLLEILAAPGSGAAAAPAAGGDAPAAAAAAEPEKEESEEEEIDLGGGGLFGDDDDDW